MKKYFYPEIKPFINEQFDDIENFEIQRQKLENESYVCSLIRNDSIVEFVKYVNQKNFNLSSQVTPSLFETNQFLIDQKPTLIEYAAFFGSIQIFDFLQLNNVALNPCLWEYAIHSNNPDLIHRLERLSVDRLYKNHDDTLYKEAIKCNNNEIAKYIQNEQIFNEAKVLVANAFDSFNIEMIKYLIETRFEIESINIYKNLIEHDFANIVGILVKEGRLDYKTNLEISL